MEILRIEWHKGQLPNYTTDGYMELKPAFFPCTVNTAKVVFKLMRDWCSEEQFTELENHLAEQKNKSAETAKTYAKIYSDAKQNLSDLLNLIESGKHPNGVKVTPSELLKARQDLKEEKRKAVQASGVARKNLALVKKYDKNIELLQQMKRG